MDKTPSIVVQDCNVFLFITITKIVLRVLCERDNSLGPLPVNHSLVGEWVAHP